MPSADDTNTFLVLTPLQLINALEAKAFFGTRNNTLIVLRHTSNGYPVSMFRRLIDEADWDRVLFLSTYDDESVTRVPVPRWTYLCYLQRKRLDKLAASLGATQNLFVGQYDSIARHFSNVLPYGTLYLIDDGTHTLKTNDERKQVADSRTLAEKSKAAIKSRIIGWHDEQAERLTFFTAYNIDPRPGDTVVLNRYVHFRHRVAAAPSNGEVWFLGEPLVLDGYVSEETYLGHLRSVQRYYGDKRIVYLPHNREQNADVGRVQTTLGCEVRRFGLPIEVALNRADRHPDHVASFISSALPNCHIMFGRTLQLTAIYLKPEHLVRHHAYVEAIYRYFRREADASFGVLELAPEPLRTR